MSDLTNKNKGKISNSFVLKREKTDIMPTKTLTKNEYKTLNGYEFTTTQPRRYKGNLTDRR